MEYKVFKIIDNNGMCIENSEVNQMIRILHAKKGEKFIFQRLSDGVSKICGVCLNIILEDVLLIKIQEETWILEPV